jgi:hypothetical protein
LSINDGGLSIRSLLVKVSSSGGSGSNESWDWWHWWESDSGTLPGDWISELNVAGLNELLWADSFNVLSHGFFITVSFSELVSLLSEFVVLLSSWTVNGDLRVHALSNSVSLSEFLVFILLSKLVSLLSSWTIDDNAGVHALTDSVSSLNELLSIEESDTDILVVSWGMVVVMLLKGNGLGRSKEKSQYGG